MQHDADSDAAVTCYVWQFLQLQIVQQQRKADPRMLYPKLAAALPEQRTYLGTSCHGSRQSMNTAMCCVQQER